MLARQEQGIQHDETQIGQLGVPDRRHAWSLYRRRRNLALALLFGWVPASVVAVLLCEQAEHPVPAALIPGIWVAAMCWAIWYAGEFRCPRCRRRFGAVGSKKGAGLLFRGLFDPICFNCKLRKFEEG